LTGYQREHKLLNSLLPRFTIGDCAGAHRAENRGKNRNVLVVPPDNIRPYLTSTVGGSSGAGALLASNSRRPQQEETDYINAVFVDGYEKNNNICINVSYFYWFLFGSFLIWIVENSLL
jgi:hypothetical protein